MDNTNNIGETQAKAEQTKPEQAKTEQAKPEQAKTEQTEQAKTEQTSYAVRPEHRHHRRLAYSDQSNMLQVRNWLNIGFMLLAIVGVILWTQVEETRTPAIVVLLIGVALKIAEVCIRLFKK